MFLPLSTCMSSPTTSINVLHDLPLRLLSSGSIPPLYHINLTSLTLAPNCHTCAVPLIYSFLILSVLVSPNANHSIFSSAFSRSSSCLFVNAIVSKPYNIAQSCKFWRIDPKYFINRIILLFHSPSHSCKCTLFCFYFL